MRPDLHKATDDLNCAITEAECAFKNLNYGVVVRMSMSESETLEFRKNDNVWRLMLTTPDASVPLVSASREQRLRAVPFLVMIPQKLIEAVEHETERVVDVARELRAFLDGFKVKP